MKLQGLRYYFPQNFRCNLTYYESKNFPDSPLNHIFEYENIRFSFYSTKNSLSWEKSWEIGSRPQVVEDSRQYLLLRTDIMTENSRWVPLIDGKSVQYEGTMTSDFTSTT